MTVADRTLTDPAATRGPVSGSRAPVTPPPSSPEPLPASVQVRRLLVGCVLGVAAWAVVLAVVAVSEGRSVLHPLGAVAAVFGGERALGLPRHPGHVSLWTACLGVLWALAVAVPVGGAFAYLTRRLPARQGWLVLLLGAVTGGLLFVVADELIGTPGSRGMQLRISSFQGFRDLGLLDVGLACALAGAVIGAWWARRPRWQRALPDGTTA